MHVLRPPSHHGANVIVVQPSPEQIYRWLGVRLALLEAPAYHTRMIGRNWESHERWDSIGNEERVRYAEARLSHELDDGETIDVLTARDDADGSSLGGRLRECLANHHLGLLARRGAFPRGDGPDYFERLEADLPREPVGTRVIPIDGRAASWIYLTFLDVINKERLVACGTRVDTSMVMIVGTETTVTSARVQMWPRPVPPLS